MNKILNPEETYTFSRYFELKIEAQDLAEEFGYTLERKNLNLPKYLGELDRIQENQSRIEEILPYVSLSNEMARREWLISPVLADLIHYTKAKVRTEYAIAVSKYLQGNLDYFLEATNKILIIEAKKADLDFGMTQLVSQLITLDQWLEDQHQTHLIGAVTTGKIWEFARLDRQAKHIEQGLESYRVPEDIESLMRILVQALQGS
ncbi:Type I restriction enzyme R protein N-terminal domain-containing protein [Tumidithrix helvetica PCC 7403]|uniref:hypothetical protein n=1 Tax=Tumidithrix helvetica TaxID=3457545 RepID=UPI003C9C778C